MTIVVTYMWGAAKDGCEFEYNLAWKHRHQYGWLLQDTPWWQWRRKWRRWKGWARAVERTKKYGKHVVYEAGRAALADEGALK